MVFGPSSGSGFLVECGGQPHSAPALGSGRHFCRGCACLILPQLSYLLDGMQTGPFSLRTDCKSLDKSETSGDRCPGGRSLGRPPRVGVASVARLLGHLSQCPKDQPVVTTVHPRYINAQRTANVACQLGQGPRWSGLSGAAGHRDPQLLHTPHPHGFLAPASCLCLENFNGRSNRKNGRPCTLHLRGLFLL